MQNDTLEKMFAGEGFVYWEVQNSPDGAFQVLNGYSEGEKSATLIEPRMVDATSGATIFNLWHTYQNYELHFGEDRRATLKVQNLHKNKSRTVALNFREGTFAFEDEPQRLYPLSTLAAKVSLF